MCLLCIVSMHFLLHPESPFFGDNQNSVPSANSHIKRSTSRNPIKLTPSHPREGRRASLEPKRRASTLATKLELELLATLLEHEWATAATETTLLERVATTTLLRIGVVATIEARAQLWVGKHLVRLVDSLHLLLRLLLGDAVALGAVRMVLLHQLAVGRLDLPLVSVARDAQYLVVVLGLAPLKIDLGFS